jgi:hypothetical protein
MRGVATPLKLRRLPAILAGKRQRVHVRIADHGDTLVLDLPVKQITTVVHGDPALALHEGKELTVAQDVDFLLSDKLVDRSVYDPTPLCHGFLPRFD